MENQAMDTEGPTINTDELIKRIRRELATRNVQQTSDLSSYPDLGAPSEGDAPFMLPPYPQRPVFLPRAPAEAGNLALKAEYSVSEFLAFHDVDF